MNEAMAVRLMATHLLHDDPQFPTTKITDCHPSGCSQTATFNMDRTCTAGEETERLIFLCACRFAWSYGTDQDNTSAE